MKKRTAEQVRRERIELHENYKRLLRDAYPNAEERDINRIAINASPFLVKSILRLNIPTTDGPTF